MSVAGTATVRVKIDTEEAMGHLEDLQAKVRQVRAEWDQMPEPVRKYFEITVAMERVNDLLLAGPEELRQLAEEIKRVGDAGILP